MQNGVRIRLNPLGGNQLNIREALRLYLPTSATPSVSDDDDDQPSSPTSQPRPRTRAIADDYDYDDDFIDDGDVDQPDDGDKQQQTEFVGFGGFWVGTDDAAKNHPVVDGNRLGNVVLEKLPERPPKPASQPNPPSRTLAPTANGTSAPSEKQPNPPQPPLPSTKAIPHTVPNAPSSTAASSVAVGTNAASRTVHQTAAPTKAVSKLNTVQQNEHANLKRSNVPTAASSARTPNTKGVTSTPAKTRQGADGAGVTPSVSNAHTKATGAVVKTNAAVNTGGAGVTKTSATPRSSKSAQALQIAITALQHFCAIKFNDKKPRLNDPVIQDHLHALLRAAISAGEAKLYSDIVREKRVVALSDELWDTVYTCLRAKRASVETLGHALIWSSREKQREKEVGRVEEVLKVYLQAKRGGAEAVRVEWSDELREMLYEWFCKKKDLLAARNQLGSRVKSVKKSVEGWVAALKKSAFQGFSVAEEEMIGAFRAVEERNKAKKRKREEERALQKRAKKDGGAPRGEVIELD